MKKLAFILMILTISLVFIACMGNQTSEDSTTRNPITSQETTTKENITTETTTEELTTENPLEIEYDLLQDKLDTYGIPSTGDVKILVFAVDFPDSKYNSLTDPSIAEIKTAFNGQSSELEFESVNSYYQKASFNQLNLTADVFGYYTVEHTRSYYESENNKLFETDPQTGEYVYGDDEVTYVESDIIYEVLKYYNDQIDYSDYDSNNDGFIDGVYIIYNNDINQDVDLWWAYQYNYDYIDESHIRGEKVQDFDGVKANYFVWASNQFIYENNESINARTYIHESGHMMGLDDYYDYSLEDSHNSGGLGSYMMDITMGDHDPFSKILLGWVKPIIIETSSTKTIKPYYEEGQVLLIIDKWNNTIFDEYLLVTYYTPDGLSQRDSSESLSISGVNIFHVSAAIGQGYNEDSYYYTIFNNNNTDTQDKLINIIEADMNDSIVRDQYAENSDLFQVGNILGDNVFENYQWYTDQALGFNLSIDSLSSDEAVITVTFE